MTNPEPQDSRLDNPPAGNGGNPSSAVLELPSSPGPGPEIVKPDIEQRIAALYEAVGDLPVPPGSFSAPGWFPSTDRPTGYALVIEKLAEAKAALTSQESVRAERLYYEAKALFNWCQANATWIVQPWPRWLPIILYEVLWLVGAVAVGQIGREWSLIGVPVPYLVWGAIGGATWALFGVWLHTIRADFDQRYLPWYLVKPLLGAIAGALVFLLADLIQEQVGPHENLVLFGAFVLGFFESLLVNVLETLRIRIRSTVGTLLGSGSG
jgi:hypothetical protein